MHQSSLNDQLLIKVRRIRHLISHSEKISQVKDSIEEDIIGVINYSLLALVQHKLGGVAKDIEAAALSYAEAEQQYEDMRDAAKALLKKKNHDYEEAWRDLRILSLCDFLLVKVLRLRKMEGEAEREKISEDAPQIYMDMVNYGVFLLIRRDFVVPQVSRKQ